MDKPKNILLPKVPYKLWKAAKMQALSEDISMTEWCMQAIQEKLGSSSSSSSSSSTGSHDK